MYAIDALLDHEEAFAALLILNGEAVLKEEEVTLSIEKSS